MAKPNIVAELEEIGREIYKKGSRFFVKSWLSGKEDKNPSVLIDVDKNTWYDFSTGKHGDSIDIEAFRKGVSRDQLVTKPVKISPEIKINEIAAKFYKASLEETQSGLEKIKELEKRGLTKEIREKLKIGATHNKANLEDFLKKYSEKPESGFNEFDISVSPLFSTKTVGDKTYRNEFFRDRIIFPISNELNQIVGFTGRTNTGDDIKYLNTSETKIFKKKEFLYNINNALSSIRKKKQVYIVEGPFDVVAYINAGIENVVSTLTCNISEQQLIKLLSLGGKDLEFVIAFDNDKAGINGIKNCMELFKQFSIWNYKIIAYQNKDAGEYIEKNQLKDLKGLLEYPLSISGYLGKFYNKTNSLSKKSSYINTFVNLVYTFPEFVVTELIKEFSVITKQSDEFIFDLLMNKKSSKEILKYIMFRLKSDKENFKLFKLLVNENLLKREEREIISNLVKFNLTDYENNYKLSNLIVQFIKKRAKEILDSFDEENPF